MTKLLSTMFLVALAATLLACGNPPTSDDCVQAAEKAGAPPLALEYLADPTGDLITVQRITLRQFLNRPELKDVCSEALDTL